MAKKVTELFWKGLDGVAILAGIPIAIMVVIGLLMKLGETLSGLWNIRLGQVIETVVGTTILGGIIYLPFYIKYRRAKARHIKWHKDTISHLLTTRVNVTAIP